MARRKKPSSTIKTRIFKALLLSTGPETPIGIVDTTMLRALIDLVSDDLIARFLNSFSIPPPDFEDPRYAGWVATCRAKYGDTQKEFANRINGFNLSLCDSDVGNLENNLRKDDYGVARRKEITLAIHSLYSGRTGP